MDGEPVWLVSVSRRNRQGKIIATGEWQPDWFRIAERMAYQTLQGVGDPGRQRAFRMNITFCIHRATSAKEKAALPACWASAPGGLAGGPIEVLWSRGIAHRPAAMPCAQPRQAIVNPQRPDLWVPEDCGRCESCLARIACRTPDKSIAS